MLGAIIGDIAGSFREFTKNNKYAELGMFPGNEKLTELNLPFHQGITDDSVLTFATAFTAMNMKNKKGSVPIESFAAMYHTFGNRYKEVIGGYGGGFLTWLSDVSKKAYNSCGNGSAMRISPVGYIGSTLNEVLELSFNSSAATHNHPEGIKGAQVTASMIYMARHGLPFSEIIKELDSMKLHYDPCSGYDHFDSICQETMPLVMHVLLTTDNFYDAVMKAVTIPYADSDTVGAIVGSVAEALYTVPDDIEKEALSFITDPDFRNIYKKFKKKYME